MCNLCRETEEGRRLWAKTDAYGHHEWEALAYHKRLILDRIRQEIREREQQKSALDTQAGPVIFACPRRDIGDER